METTALRPPAHPTDRDAGKRKMTFYLTEEERQAFLIKRGEAGHTDSSAFIVEALGLGQSDEVSS